MTAVTNTKPHTLVIGAGSGGLTVAIGLARLGKPVALIEKGHIGGDCTNAGCVPSKALIHAAKANFKNPLTYAQGVIKQIRAEESPEELAKFGIDVIKGTARFKNSREVEVITKSSTTIYRPKHVVIATGSNPAVIPIKGLPANKQVTNQSFFKLKQLPKQLTFIGVGPISCELAQAAAMLGSEVHVIYRKDRILKNISEDAAHIVQNTLESAGVTFHWNIHDMEYRAGKLMLLDKNGATVSELKTEYVFQAVGRTPQIEALDLPNANLIFDKSGIQVDHRYRTNHKHIYAIGDCIPEPKFTHLANAQGREVVKDIGLPFLIAHKVKHIPATTFTSPEVAEAGLSLEKLQSIPVDSYRSITVQIQDMDRAKTDNVSHGQIRVWATKLTGKILRAEIIAEDAGNLIAYWALAIQKNLSLWKLYAVILPYPTFALMHKKVSDSFVSDTLSHLQSDVAAQVKQIAIRHGSKLVTAILWTTLIVGSRQYMLANNLDFLGLTNQLSDLIRMSSIGPLIYLIVYILRPVILFPATLLAILAGFLYGLQKGYILALIAGTASALIPYLVGRWVSHEDTHQEVSRFTAPLKTSPFQTVLIMRLIYLPYDLVSLVAGHAKVTVAQFFGATALGNLIGTLTFVSLGASLEGEITSGNIRLNPSNLVFSIALFFAGLGISKLVNRALSENKKR